MLWGGRAIGATIHVPGDAPTIQAGIDAALPGDVVLVAPGIYMGAGNKNLELGSKDIEVRSAAGPQVTVIDCEGSGRAFFLLGPLTPAAVIDGFTMRNGDGGGGEPIGGGGMFIGGGSPTVVNCHFERNTAVGVLQDGGGGAISTYISGSTISRCTFLQNTATGRHTIGGALALHESNIKVSECRFEQNTVAVTSGVGGGIGVSNRGTGLHTVLEDCEFYGNEAGVGGGAFGGRWRVTRCIFRGNRARSVGGLFSLVGEVVDCTIVDNGADAEAGGLEVSGTVVKRCTIRGNSAREGGGLRCLGPATLITDCVIAHNSASVRGGGVMGVVRESQFVNCTIVDNEAPVGSGALLSSAEPATWRFENTIISYGGGGEAIRCQGAASAWLSCSDVFGNAGGDWVGCLEGQVGVRGNFSADPRFCDREQHDLTLAANSPCLPGNHPQGAQCGLIGALGEGCPPAAVEERTWGAIKARFRD